MILRPVNTRYHNIVPLQIDVLHIYKKVFYVARTVFCIYLYLIYQNKKRLNS